MSEHLMRRINKAFSDPFFGDAKLSLLRLGTYFTAAAIITAGYCVHEHVDPHLDC